MEETRLDSDVQKLFNNLGKLPDPVVRSFLIVVGGLPGTGKSYFSGRLREKLPAVILESDALRKVLFPSPTYDLFESSRLFQAFHRLTEELLRKGIPVILDATNLLERHREYFYRVADRLGVKLILVWVEAPPEVVKERLQARHSGDGTTTKSDADWKVYQKMKPIVEKIRRKHYVVDTSLDITLVINKIVKEVSR